MSYLATPSTEDVSHEISSVQTAIADLARNENDHTARQALLASARALVTSLETPKHLVARLSWDEPTRSAALRVLIDLNMFKLLASKDAPSKASELAQKVGADPVLIQRLFKRVASSDPPLVEETGPDEYSANRWTRGFADDVNVGAFTDMYDGWTPACSKILEFMKKVAYQNPTSKDNTIWQFGSGNTATPFFDFLQTRPARLQAFSNHMKFKSAHQNWYDTVPLDAILPADFDPEAVLLVDVGGNQGHDLLGFHAAHPAQPGRLILQDLGGPISALDKQAQQALALASIEPMAHDFFTPQPVVGAKAYYLKMVLHDWPDAQCREILSNLKPALVRGFSKILINEIVVLDQGADGFSTEVDLIMMVFHSSWERREKQWRELVESVGLKVTKMWPCGGVPEKLIEVELA